MHKLEGIFRGYFFNAHVRGYFFDSIKLNKFTKKKFNFFYLMKNQNLYLMKYLDLNLMINLYVLTETSCPNLKDNWIKKEKIFFS